MKAIVFPLGEGSLSCSPVVRVVLVRWWCVKLVGWQFGVVDRCCVEFDERRWQRLVVHW